MIGCNETEILHPNISRALDGEVIKKDIGKLHFTICISMVSIS